MYKYAKKITFMTFYSIGFLLLQGCFYSYNSVHKEIDVGYDSNVDSFGKLYLTLEYSGNESSIAYKAKEKITDSILENFARLYFDNNRIKDSLKMEGIKFWKFLKGCGWTERVDKDYIFVENQNIAKIDTVWDCFLDDSIYAGSKIILSIFSNGSTTLVPNRGKEQLKIKVTSSNGKVNIQGEKLIKITHKKSFFKYLFSKD